jgi:hypothetical protein
MDGFSASDGFALKVLPRIAAVFLSASSTPTRAAEVGVRPKATINTKPVITVI